MKIFTVILCLTLSNIALGYRADGEPSRNVIDARHTCPNFDAVKSKAEEFLRLGVNENPAPSLPPKITKGVLEMQKMSYERAAKAWDLRSRNLQKMLMKNCSYPSIGEIVEQSQRVALEKKKSYEEIVVYYEMTISDFGQ